MSDKTAILSTYLETGHLPEHDCENLDAFPAIREFIKPRLKGMGFTQESVAEAVNMSTSTVSKYLSGTTRDGNIHTVGPLCRLARFSLDEYFGITSESPEIAAEKQRRHEDVDKLLSHMEERHASDLRARRNLIYSLLTLCLVLSLALSALLLLDAADRTSGLVRTGTAFAAVCVFIAFLVAALLAAVLHIRRLRLEMQKL